ncbi:MAG: hypothetical protein EBS84_15630 [Proteobacteria bacterium]|nr:hypothetical protein [Pseudomonadota bacterium]
MVLARGPIQSRPACEGPLSYEYDFGDSWEHKIPVEKLPTPRPSMWRRSISGRKN